MRSKTTALLIVGLGSFVLTVSLMGRFYAYDRVAVMPAAADIDVVAKTASDAPATWFDMASLSEKTGALTSRTSVRGIPSSNKSASKATGENAVVWWTHNCVQPNDAMNCLKDRNAMSATIDVMAFAAHGSQVLKWDGNYRETGGSRSPNTKTSGYVFKLPFNVGQHDYKWWNGDLGMPVALTYEGATSVKGLKVYKFQQDVKATQTGTIDLPGSLIGSAEASVKGDVMYAGQLDMTVEPETGVQITTVQKLDKWVEVDGKRVLTMVSGTFTVDDATVTKSVADYQTMSFLLHLLRVWVPIGGSALGLLLMVLGVVLSRRRVALSPEATAEPARVPEFV